MEGELINEQETLDGELGYKGERGYSSYEIAVLNGFEGTEQDWLNHFGVDLTGYINTNDVIDNLTSTSTNYPLSANQGKELKSQIDTLDNTVSIINQNAIVKGDFAIITVTAPVVYNSDVSKIFDYKANALINYPNGFNKDNSYVINCRFIHTYINDYTNIPITFVSTNKYINGSISYTGQTNGIEINYIGDTFQNGTFTFEVVLMKM